MKFRREMTLLSASVLACSVLTGKLRRPTDDDVICTALGVVIGRNDVGVVAVDVDIYAFLVTFGVTIFSVLLMYCKSCKKVTRSHFCC